MVTALTALEGDRVHTSIEIAVAGQRQLCPCTREVSDLYKVDGVW